MMTELERCFARYGVTVRVEPGEGEAYTTKAFVQPVRETEKEFPFAVTGLGSADDRHWLCLSRSALREGDRVWMGEACYVAVNCAAVYLDEQVCHWRSILTPEREAAV